MGKTITLRRGFDIRLKGAAAQVLTECPFSDVMAVKPPDFPQVKPKILVKPGDIVQAGQCLFHDKHRPELRFTSPVSGEVAEIILGQKRRPLEIRILPDRNETRYISFPHQTSSIYLLT